MVQPEAKQLAENINRIRLKIRQERALKQTRILLPENAKWHRELIERIKEKKKGRLNEVKKKITDPPLIEKIDSEILKMEELIKTLENSLKVLESSDKLLEEYDEKDADKIIDPHLLVILLAIKATLES